MHIHNKDMLNFLFNNDRLDRKSVNIAIECRLKDEWLNDETTKLLINHPFTDYKYIGDKIYIKSEGSLSVGTNYLILCDGKDFIRLRNTQTNPIKIKGDVFISSKSNLLI